MVNLFWVLVATYYESEVVLRRLFSFLGVLVSTIAHLVKLGDLEVG